MLSHVRRHIGLTVCRFIEGENRILRHDGAGLCIAAPVPKAVSIAPTVNLLPPLRQYVRIRQRPLITIHLCCQLLVQLVQNRAHGAYDGDINRHDFGNRGGVNINMNDFGPGAKFRHRIGHAIIKTCTDSQNHIGVMHGHVGFIKTVHAQHTQKLPVTAGECAQAHERIGDGIIQPSCQRG